jgi:immunity protein 17 of polymorphic toxin system
MNWWGLLGAAFGALFLAASVWNWKWFWTRGRQGFGARIFGRTVARYLYGMLGIAFIVLGTLAFFNIYVLE